MSLIPWFLKMVLLRFLGRGCCVRCLVGWRDRLLAPGHGLESSRVPPSPAYLFQLIWNFFEGFYCWIICINCLSPSSGILFLSVKVSAVLEA